jgi:peptidoglycan/xylan/chitin deacetylase (PgdA/CDA1 family)
VSFGDLTLEYLRTASGAAVLALMARGAWRALPTHRRVGLIVALMLVAVGSLLLVVLTRWGDEERIRAHAHRNYPTPANLLAPALPVSAISDALQPSPPLTPTTSTVESTASGSLRPGMMVSSNLLAVRPGNTYRYSMQLGTGDSVVTEGLVRFLWLDAALNVLAWDDSLMRVETMLSRQDLGMGGLPAPSALRTGAYTAPVGAAYLRFELRNTDRFGWLHWRELVLMQDGVYVELHPNGTQAALAFSFDWESAMGGAIHSKGMTVHDPQAAAQHGMAMRQGADWLKDLFARHGIRATFYATGYNLLDGNAERRTFAGDPTYRWASPANGWASDYWLTHKWYSDDPHGTYQTHPEWYFGDQTRALLQAGHEVAPHTFGHLYVRGSTPQELAADMDEWLAAAARIGISQPTTFAFPWRSSNSLTPEFYNVLYRRGISSVTRLYERDLRDRYTLSPATPITATGMYTGIAVMPDFELGKPSAKGGEEAGGRVLGAAEGLRVIQEVIARRGTTSLWTHPEQLAPGPSSDEARRAWEQVVAAAARERDNGRLWIAPVGEIAAFQRDALSVTAQLDAGFMGLGVQGWALRVHNASGKELNGITLTLPGEVVRVSSPDVEVLTVVHDETGATGLSPANKPAYPTRQLVLNGLRPGTTNLEVQWAPGQEPPR